MDVDPARHPSRRAWPLHTGDTTTPAGTHSHKLPRAWLAAFTGLWATVLVVIVVLALMVLWVTGLRHDRVTEQQRQQEQTREGICALLDQFPAGSPVLQPSRDKFRCGPGTPLSQLPPAVRQQFGAPSTPRATQTPVAPATPTPASQPIGGAGPTSPPATEAPAPPRPPGAPPSPSPTPGPLDPLLCSLLPKHCHVEAP